MQLPSRKAQIIIGGILISVLCFFVYEVSAQMKGENTALKKFSASIGIGTDDTAQAKSDLPQGLWAGASTTDESVNAETAKFLDPNNITNKIAQNLSIAMLSKDANGSLSQTPDAELVGEALKDITVDINVTQYDQSNISIFTPKNKDEIKNYANKIASIYRNEAAKLVNRKDFPSNEEAIAFYEQISKQMLSVPVPVELAQPHLDLINNFSASYSVLKEINNYQKDPAKGVLSIKTFEELESGRGDITTKIVNYFKINGIIFENNEAGKIWYETATI